MAERAPTPAKRRHRPREETRALLLQAAARVAIGRVRGDDATDHNPLADVRIKDVLAEVNRDVDTTGGRTMTTGAFYQIWADQQEFQRELLSHLMDRIALPGINNIEARAFAMVAAGEPAESVIAAIADLDFRLSREEPEIFLALGLGAFAPAEAVRGAQREANQRFLRVFGDLLENVLTYAGWRLVDGRSMADLIWALEALEVGYLLRWRTDPELPERVGPDGRTMFAAAFLGVIQTFTSPIGDTHHAHP